MAQRVEDLYNDLAIITGFPIYTSDTDTPDTSRLLFHVLTQAMQNLIDNLYIDNNVLQRTDTLTTKANEDLYGVDGLIKNCQLIDEKGRVYRLPYNDRFNPHEEIQHNTVSTSETSTTDTISSTDTTDVKLENTGRPECYVIQNGYLRLLPMPDKEYTIKLTLSTTDLVWAYNNEAKNKIDSIEDIVLADKRFCDLIVLKAAVLLFARAQNANAQVYADLTQQRLNTYIEHDNKTMEAQRGFIRRAGHYDPRRGLLD